MSLWTFDVEADGFIAQLTQMWCACFKKHHVDEWVIFTDVSKIHPSFLEAFNDDIAATWLDKSALVGWLATGDITGLICHNMIQYDLKVFAKLYGVSYTVGKDTINGRPIDFIDTYIMSTRQKPNRALPFGCPTHVEVVGQRKLKKIGAHGLEGWGYRVGNMKPSVVDWREQPLQVYLNRCIEDVKINELTYDALIAEKEMLMRDING